MTAELIALLDEYATKAFMHGYTQSVESRAAVLAARAAVDLEIGKLVEDAERLNWLDQFGQGVQCRPCDNTSWSTFALPGTLRSTIDSYRAGVAEVRARDAASRPPAPRTAQ